MYRFIIQRVVMRIKPIIFFIGLLPMISLGAKNWSIKSTKDWAECIEHNQGVAVKEGTVSPSEQSGMIRTKLKAFKKKRSAKTLTISQSPLWQNWNPRPRIAPKNLRDAPVFLAKGPDDYWMFGRYGGFGNSASKGFKAKDAKLEGFDIPLKPHHYQANLMLLEDFSKDSAAIMPGRVEIW